MSKKTKAELLHDVENLQKECDQLKCKILQYEQEELKKDTIRQHEIDFGTGKLYYMISWGSAIALNELMQALKDAALVVPLHTLIRHIKKAPGYPDY